MSTNPKIVKLPCNFSNAALYNGVYIPLFYNNSRFLHLFGSAGSGKSVFGCQKEIVLSFDSRRAGRKTLVVRKYYNSIKESIYSELKKVIYGWGLAHHFEIGVSPLKIRNKLTGVEFVFFGLDDVEKLKSISGIDRVIIEEATEMTSQNELDQLSLRLRGFDAVQITLMYNPVSVFHWINTEIHQKGAEDHFIFKTTYKDNRFLDDAYIDSLHKLAATNPNYHKIYVLGEWGQKSEGVIYQNYETVAEMPEPDFYGLDFGYNDPTALIAGSIRDNFGSERKDYFVDELIYETHLTSANLIARMELLNVSKSKPIIADSARPEMIQDLLNAGYNVRPCTKYKGSVLDGINRVKTYNLKIVAGGKNLFKEISNYSWTEKGGRFLDNTPRDGTDHAMDATRYGLESTLVIEPEYETTTSFYAY